MTSTYSPAIQEVKRVIDWVWPHRHVVYPVNRYRAVLDTPQQRKGRKMLLSVLCYLETAATAEMGGDRCYYKGFNLAQ